MINRRFFSQAAGMAAAVALTSGALIASTANAESAAEINAPAPAFMAMTSDGEAISLADFAGKTVVLEWTNDGCPFVQKHYSEPRRNMQTLQGDASQDDVVWLSVISSAPGKQGYAEADRANELTTSRGAAPHAVILDSSGDLGRLYGAKTTPHMYIVSAEGTLEYMGAIDSKPTARADDIDTAENYVVAALADIAADRSVATPVTKAYGCSVKY